MSTEAPPTTDVVVPLSRGKRLALPLFVAAVQASLRVSPRPMALLLRNQFARGGALTKAELDRHAPSDVLAFVDEQYGDGVDTRLDVYVPEAAVPAGDRLPTIVWVHGGGWVGGGKSEIAGYMKVLAGHGFVSVAISYSLAPDAKYPTPVRQTMDALRYVCDNATRFNVDPARLFLCGDSAGAQIAAQVATLVTNPAYVREVGVTPSIEPAQLRAVGLCCGPYDPELADDASPFNGFLTAILWSYSGTRDWRSNRYFATSAVSAHVTEAFPPAFVTVGNADPLVEHSRQLSAALVAQHVEIDALFYAHDHQPPLAHEYQFHLDGDDAKHALGRLVSFFQRHASPGA